MTTRVYTIHLLTFQSETNILETHNVLCDLPSAYDADVYHFEEGVFTVKHFDHMLSNVNNSIENKEKRKEFCGRIFRFYDRFVQLTPDIGRYGVKVILHLLE